MSELLFFTIDTLVPLLRTPRLADGGLHRGWDLVLVAVDHVAAVRRQAGHGVDQLLQVRLDQDLAGAGLEGVELGRVAGAAGRVPVLDAQAAALIVEDLNQEVVALLREPEVVGVDALAED